ncbi:MAG: SUMF1/EgtB/PvdO family nonheme iron enzyme [Bacteroidia bacterium]|nr:SUMF1/EgtB/PvdO family nonheme iron enzyme [Bacteroidia bacterium]NNJ54845.1 SUMF1/EgtB/PvdO family nonheme iron enzyme [Bacteroidia bacterium]
MKYIAKALVMVTFFSLVGCGMGDNGELIGVQGRSPWFHPQPFGTVYIPTGTFHTGQSDEDIFHTYIAPNKQISVHAMWMDDTEITNNEYRQFVEYVKDSIARSSKYLGLVTEGIDDHEILDYEEEIDYNESYDDLEQMYYQGKERYEFRRQIDIRKLEYNYQWIDFKAAARGDYFNSNRADYIKENTVKIYPDTLVWIRDFTYSYNEPMTRQYFYHPKYDDYPVVGVSWHQANAFCNWRTRWLNRYWMRENMPITEYWRLPTEFEWEFAARGGRDNNMYPWGGPYTRNSKGCLLANFKPNRGNYMADGGLYPVRADSYFPNDYGLYNMAGNVAEWTISAYDESSHQFTHDLNSDYQYDAEDDGPLTLKRKVTRGGSWKDVAYFIQNGSRSYEYQDTSKSFIGFRCVQTYIGRSATDSR